MKYANHSQTTAWRVVLLIVRYGGGVVCAAAAFGIRQALTLAVGPGLPPYVVFLSAIMAVSLLAGMGPGILATAVASFMAAFWMDPPVGQLKIANPIDVVGLVLFAAMGVSMSVVAALFWRHRQWAAEYQKELSARESEKRFSTIFHASPIGLAITRPADGRYLDVNEEFLRLTGFSRDEVVGETAIHLKTWVNPEDRNAFITQLSEQRRIQVRFAQFRKKSGEVWLARLSAEVIEIGGEEAVLSLLQDITEQNRAETLLRESEQRYRSLFQNMLNGFAYCRMIFEDDTPRDFIYLEVNPAFQTLTGLQDVAGRKVTEVIPGMRESNPEVFEIYGRVSLTGNPERFETYIPALKIWFSISAFCTQKEHFVAIFENITDRKNLEQSLLQEKTLLLTLVNSIPELVYVKDRESRFVVANKATADFMGVIDPAQLIGKTDHDFYPRDLADKYLLNERRVVEQGIDIVSQEEPSRSSKGGFRWLLNTKVPLRGETGEVIGLVGSSLDITQRKLTEQRYKEQAALLDITSDAILIRDVRNRIVYWNKSATGIYGWTFEDAQGRDANELLFSPAHSEEPVQALAIVTETGEWSGEFHQRSKDGRELTIEARWTLVRAPQGTPTGVLSVNSDVTERRAIQSQLLRVQRLESLGTLAGGIAHDLNNVLTPILMGVEGLSLYKPDDKSRKILDIIKMAAQRGASIVRQVLSFARGSGGELSEIQLKHVLREVEQIVEETFPKSIEIRTQIPKDLPPIMGNATQIHQVLMNLCVNARDAMPDGGRLTLSSERVHLDLTYARMHIDAKPIDYVMLQVEDTGTGIPPALMEKIFDPFFTTKEPGKGTGLGLSTTLTIVKSHGGFINVYSEINKGSAFKVYLPAAIHAAEEGSELSTEGIPMGKGELILVVDDEAAVREIARQILESYGYQVATANDGADAVALFVQKNGEIRAVITDLMMPYMDGAATIRALRRIDPEVKVIVTSGLLGQGQSRSTTNLGIQEFLAKPYTANTLLETLRRVLDSAPSLPGA